MKHLSKIRIFIGYECSGAMANAFHRIGFDVTSCDLKESVNSPNHIVCHVLSQDLARYDFGMFFPPCTYLAKAQLWRCNKDEHRKRLQDLAIEEIRWVMDSGIHRFAIENPAGALTKSIGPSTQIVYPWYFGDPYRKEIHLWLRGMPPLMSTCFNPVRKPIANKVNGRMSQDLKSEIKSSWLHYPSMCNAIANQWAAFLTKDVK